MSKAKRAQMKKADPRRDGGRFVPFPHVVLESPAYRNLSHTARSLLLDISMQHNRQNNGKLVACAKYLRPLGWKSADTVNRAKRELIDSQLLIETRKGARPNRAAWYMLAWHELDVAEGLDAAPSTYAAMRRQYHSVALAPQKNTVPAPPRGVVRRAIAPSNGVRTAILAPSHGAMEA